MPGGITTSNPSTKTSRWARRRGRNALVQRRLPSGRPAALAGLSAGGRHPGAGPKRGALGSSGARTGVAEPPQPVDAQAAKATPAKARQDERRGTRAAMAVQDRSRAPPAADDVRGCAIVCKLLEAGDRQKGERCRRECWADRRTFARSSPNKGGA